MTLSPILISKRRGLAAQALRHQLQRGLVLAEEEGVLLEEDVEDLALVHAQRAQDDGDRQLAAAVDAREHGSPSGRTRSRATSRDRE